MPDPDPNEKLVETAMPPIHVAVIGGTGDGGVRPQTIETPKGQRNVVLTPISTALALGIRFVDTFLTALIAVAGLGGLTDMIPFEDFADLLRKGASAGVIAGGVGFIKDMASVVGKLKQKYPLLDV